MSDNSDTVGGTIDLEAFERRAWSEALALFEVADATEPLDPPHLERFATVAQLVGAEERSSALWERAHRRYQERADLRGQARTAFWLAFGYMDRGEMAQAGGWLSRAQRILEDSDLDCPERAYVRVPQALGRLGSGPPRAWSENVVDPLVLHRRATFGLARGRPSRLVDYVGQVRAGLPA